MQIQWYPGHMTKAKRAILEDIKLIDLVIEILDARIPLSSRNPDIDDLAKGKCRLIILNKADLADDGENRKWQQYFKEKGIDVILLDSRNNSKVAGIDGVIRTVMAEKIEKDSKRGIINPVIRALVVGIPNVGKSTFINAFAKKAVAKTGNKPGVTKGKQWIKVNKNLELLDTPGILWPKFDDERVGENLAITGSINDNILDITELCCVLMSKLLSKYRDRFLERYSINEDDVEAAERYAMNDIMKCGILLENIAQRKKIMKKGNVPDTDRMAATIVDDFRNGKLGRLTIEYADSFR